MDKIHCDIVKDLLPLYVEDVCSEKSKAEIERHLEACEDCKCYYEMLKEDNPKVEKDWTSSNLLEGEFIQGIEKKIKKKITFDMVVAGFVVFLACAIGSVMYTDYVHEPGFELFGLIDTRLETEDITITDLYQLESGEIFFTAKSDKKFTWPYTDAAVYDEEKNIYYSTGMCTYSWWNDHIEQSGTLREGAFICSPVAWDAGGNRHEISEIRFEGKGDESILVWEKGQELEPAPEEIEREVEERRFLSEDPRGAYWIYTKSALETLE